MKLLLPLLFLTSCVGSVTNAHRIIAYELCGAAPGSITIIDPWEPWGETTVVCQDGTRHTISGE